MPGLQRPGPLARYHASQKLVLLLHRKSWRRPNRARCAHQRRDRAGSKAGANQPFKGLDYLEADHLAVEAVGFDPETAKALGIGFGPRCMMSGLVAVPLRLEDGTLAGYIGISEAKLPKTFHLTPGNILKFPKIA